jgi:glycine/D-amino acid oxidase-like deaminating enzyme
MAERFRLSVFSLSASFHYSKRLNVKFTRREILTAFLGAPFALAACRNASREVAGEIVGANVSVGHILRELRSVEVPEANWESIGIAIVGGGAAGLSAGYGLQKADRDFVLLELESKIGGTAQNGESELIGYPWGAHYLPVPFADNTELASLIDEMSLTDGRGPDGELLVKEQYLCREPEERVFFKGRWYEGLYLHAGESEIDKAQYAAFQQEVDNWVSWRDARGKRAFVLPVANCSRDSQVLALDRISFGEWLRNSGFTSERLLWYCDYACRDDYGLKLDQTSAWAGLFYFCSRVRKSGEESQPFITFPEGNGRFVNFLHDKIKERVRLNAIVLELVPNEKGVDVIYLRDGEIRGIRAKKVIYASPIFTSKYVIRDFKQKPPPFIQQFEHNAWFVANLFLKDRPKNRFPRDFPLSWDNVLYESPSLGYVNSTHQKGLDHGPAVFTYYYPMCGEDNGREKLLSLNHRDLTDIILSDLSRAHTNIRELTERIDVMRWGHAMISPRTGFVSSSARDEAQKPFRNIHFAHSDLSGIALFEEAFYHGVRAAKEVI